MVSKKITHDWDQNYSGLISYSNYLFSQISLLLQISEIKYAACHQIMAHYDEVAVCSKLVLNFESTKICVILACSFESF